MVAITQKARRCVAVIGASGSPASLIISQVRYSITSGKTRAPMATTRLEYALKVRTKVIRYSASGTTQSSGTAATSVEMYAVTASIRLDGTKDSPIHRARRPQVTTSAFPVDSASEDDAGARRHITTAQARVRTTAAL